MISGKHLSLCLLLATLPALAAESDPAGAARAMALVRTLARPAPARTAYTEVRFIGMLDRALVLRGEMTWLGGSRLQRSVVTPYPETTTIDGDTATLQRGQRAPQKFSLGRAPELKDLLGSFVALLSGDALALARNFTLHAYGDQAAWTLDLAPRDAAVARRIRDVSVDGSGKTLRCMRVDETDGDTTFTLLGPLGDAKLPDAPTPAGLATLCAGA